MSWLFEDSTPVLVITSLLEMMLVVALLRTGQRRFLTAILLTGALAGTCVAIEWFVETEREQLARVVEQTRQAVLTNDREQIFLWIDPDSSILRKEVAGYLAQYELKAIKITNGPEITVHHTDPMVADVRVTARIDLAGKATTIAYTSVLLRVEARAAQTSAGWRWTEARFAHPLSR